MIAFLSKKVFAFLMVSVFLSVSTKINCTTLAGAYSLKTGDYQVDLFQDQAKYADLLSLYNPKAQDVEIESSDIALTTGSGRAFSGQLFVNGKNNRKDVLVVSLGKGAEFKEKEPYIRAFSKNYDVFIFQYDWWMPEYQSFSERINISKRFFEHNQDEVIAVVEFLRLRDYDQIIGLGECYSAYTLAAAEAFATRNGRQLFSKLIFDSCLISVKKMAAAVIKDPWLFLSNHFEGGTPKIIKNIMGKGFVFRPLHFFVSLMLPDLNVTDYLQDIKIPVLFIRGINDPAISTEDFDQIWESVPNGQKAALMTPFHHVNNFKRAGRNAYLYVANLFIQESFDTFLQELQA